MKDILFDEPEHKLKVFVEDESGELRYHGNIDGEDIIVEPNEDGVWQEAGGRHSQLAEIIGSIIEAKTAKQFTV